LAENNGLNLNIDKFIHERARLLILTHLVTNERREVSFNDLRSALDMTAGNLSVQLRNLEEAGYIYIDKSIEERKTITRVGVTPQGFSDFMLYLNNLEKIIRSIKE